MSHPVSHLYLTMWETELEYQLNHHQLLLRFQKASQRRFVEAQDSTQNYVVTV